MTIKGEDLLKIPEAEEISEIVVNLYDCDRIPDVKDFVLPRAYYSEILEYFEDPVLATDVWICSGERGSLRIRDRAGRSVRLYWYWLAAKTRLWFSIHGVRCESGTFCDRAKRRTVSISEAGALQGRLRQIYQECTGQDVSTIQLSPQEMDELAQQEMEKGEPGVGADSR